MHMSDYRVELGIHVQAELEMDVEFALIRVAARVTVSVSSLMQRRWLRRLHFVL